MPELEPATCKRAIVSKGVSYVVHSVRMRAAATPIGLHHSAMHSECAI